jgi:hypothetical protein
MRITLSTLRVNRYISNRSEKGGDLGWSPLMDPKPFAPLSATMHAVRGRAYGLD